MLLAVSPHQMTLGEQLRSFRVRIGLSQAVLAKASSLHPNTVASLERGERGQRVNADTLDRLARGLNLTMAERDVLYRCAGLDPESRDFLLMAIDAEESLDVQAKRSVKSIVELLRRKAPDRH